MITLNVIEWVRARHWAPVCAIFGVEHTLDSATKTNIKVGVRNTSCCDYPSKKIIHTDDDYRVQRGSGVQIELMF